MAPTHCISCRGKCMTASSTSGPAALPVCPANKSRQLSPLLKGKRAPGGRAYQRRATSASYICAWAEGASCTQVMITPAPAHGQRAAPRYRLASHRLLPAFPALPLLPAASHERELQHYRPEVARRLLVLLTLLAQSILAHLRYSVQP